MVRINEAMFVYHTVIICGNDLQWHIPFFLYVS